VGIKTLSRTLSHVHDEGRTYLGEQSAEPLLAYLNAGRRGKKKPGVIEELVLADRKLASLAESFEGIDKIHRLLRRLKLTATLTPVLHTSKFRPGGYHSWKIDWFPRPLAALLGLAEKGLLDRVRSCAKPGCGRFFFARFSHQRFHSQRCQDQTYRTSLEWKKKKRAYMKNLRHREALRDAAARLDRPRMNSK